MSESTDSAASFIGEPVFNGDNNKRRPNQDNANWKIDTEGSHFYRILPPFGLLATSGYWSFYESLHWGFSASNGKKRVFRCIQRKSRKGMIEQECPMCTKITEMKNLRDSRVKKMESEKRSKEDIADAVKPISLWLQTFNLDKGHYLNAMRPDGQIGRLKIKIKCKQSLDLVIKELRAKENINPISASQGVWFDFQRHGTTQTDTTYQVKVVMEPVEVNGRKLQAIKDGALTQEQINRMKTEAFELASYYKDLSYDEIKMLVGSDNNPEIVDSVFGAPTITKTETPVPEEVEEEEVFSAPPASNDDDMEAKLMLELQKLQAKKSTGQAGNKTISTEDFLKTFSTNNGK